MCRLSSTKSLVYAKDSQTVGHTPLMVSKCLASKRHANAAHKSEYCLRVSVSAAVKTRRWEWLHGGIAPEKKRYFPAISLLFDNKNRLGALVPPVAGPLLDLHLLYWCICGGIDPTPAPVFEYIVWLLILLQCAYPARVGSGRGSLLA